MTKETTHTEAAHARDEEVSQSVRVQQMRMLLNTPLPGMVMATAFAFALAWQIRGHVSHQALATWLSFKVAAVLPRFAHALLFKWKGNDDLRWLRVGILLLFFDGLAWGSAGVLLMLPYDQPHMTVIAASLSGIAVLGAFAIQADWRACAAFTLPTMAPSVFYFALRLDEFGVYGAFSLATFTFLLLSAAKRVEKNIVELLFLRYSNAKLTSDLSHALEVARQEGQAKDAFLANMSHELRTPLHGILGLSRTLARQVDVEARHTLSLIRRSGEHLLGLINNILEFSRFKDRGFDLHPTAVDLHGLVAEVVAMCEPQAVERDLRLSTEILLPNPCNVYLDPYRVRQVLLNLLGNALKFTNPGDLILVRAMRAERNQRIFISVADTGIGISQEDLEAIFEPFKQADASPTRRRGGTGLGLYITRQICLAMGGDVNCETTLGKGSVFTVNIPYVQASDNAPAPHHAGFPNSQPSVFDSAFIHTPAHEATVLLAEDNEVNAIVAAAYMSRVGLNVEHVLNGLGVVERMCTTARRPDVVLLDCQMPEMDGYAASRAVRKFEAEHNLDPVPIIALTANVFQQDRELCEAAGMNGFLGKPFTEHELQLALARHGIGPLAGEFANSRP